MSLKPVSGKIESQELNDNFSYLDTRIGDIISTPADSVSAQEIIDAREGERILGDRIRNIASGEDMERESITPPKTDFLVLDKELNLYDGEFERISLVGARDAKQVISYNKDAKTAVIEIEPNTTYSVIREPSSIFKIATDTVFNRGLGQELEGSVNIWHGGSTGQSVLNDSFTTGDNDVVLYVYYTNENEDTFIQIVEGLQTDFSVNDYIFRPNEKLPIYTKNEIDSMEYLPDQMLFLDKANLFDGDFLRISLIGNAEGGFTPTENEESRTAKIKIKPNTTYSVIRKKQTSTFKVGTDIVSDRLDGKLQGSVRIHHPFGGPPNHVIFTTGPNDVELYVQYTSTDEDVYIEIVEGEQTYPEQDRYGLYLLSEDIIPRNPKLKILFISNSFGNDSIRWVSQTAKSCDVNVIIANAHLSGASLQTNYENAVNDEPIYTYIKHDSGGTARLTDMTIKEILQDESWDVVIFQQSSSLSHNYATYEPYLSNFLSWAKSNATNADVQFGLNMVWSYAEDFSENFTPLEQWEDNADAYKQALKNNDLHILIPTGTAIQNARTNEDLNSVGDELTRDGAHLDYGIGRYIAGLTTFYSLIGSRFNKTIDGVSFIPSTEDDSDISNENMNNYLTYLAKLCTKSAIDKPFELSVI